MQEEEEEEEEEEEYLQKTVRGTTTDTEDRQTACVGGGKEEEPAATTTTEQIGSQVTAVIEPVGKQHSPPAKGAGGGKGIDAGRVRDEMMFTRPKIN